MRTHRRTTGEALAPRSVSPTTSGIHRPGAGTSPAAAAAPGAATATGGRRGQHDRAGDPAAFTRVGSRPPCPVPRSGGIRRRATAQPLAFHGRGRQPTVRGFRRRLSRRTGRTRGPDERGDHGTNGRAGARESGSERVRAGGSGGGPRRPRRSRSEGPRHWELRPIPGRTFGGICTARPADTHHRHSL